MALYACCWTSDTLKHKFSEFVLPKYVYLLIDYELIIVTYFNFVKVTWIEGDYL